MTVFYPDVSHYNAGVDITGAAAVVAKATQGTTYVDPSYVTFRTRAQELGIPFGAYHWVDTSDIAAQAAHAHSVIGSVPTMWDCEAPGATVERIVALTAAYRALGGNPRLVYLPHWWWEDLGSPDLRPLTAAGLALVSSDYPVTGYTDPGPGWAPYGGVTPAIWQYTDRQPFGGQAVDLNAFRGTVDQLRALLGLTTTGGEMSLLIVEQDGPNKSAVWLTNGVVRRAVATTDEMAMLRHIGLATNAVDIPVSHANLAQYGVDVATLTGGTAAPVDATAIAEAIVADPALMTAFTKAVPAAVATELATRLAQ